MKFDLPKELSSIIKVVGVGGGGSNAVNYMFSQGIQGVDFLVCNTDKQALDVSPVPVKLQLGAALTEGLGAGSVPDRGREAAQENLDQIRQILDTRTKMLFITAGMGGGTGTGAAPVVAEIAREMGILTVGIVTMPFNWEGKKRAQQATKGIEEMRQAVDTLLIINNDRLRDLYGNLSMDEAFGHADNVLTTAARGIAEIITKTGKVNVDFEDVKTVMTRSGVAIMGMAEAEGEDRALRAAQEALNSPLLNDNDIRGAKFVLLNISHGSRDLVMDEITEITDHIQEAAGSSADVIWGYCREESLGDKLRVTLIATGFNQNPEIGGLQAPKAERIVIPIDAPIATMITQPIANPVTGSSEPASSKPEVKKEVSPFEPYIKTTAPMEVEAVKPPVQAPVAPAPLPVAEEKREVVEPFLKVVPAVEAPKPTPVAEVPAQRVITFDIAAETETKVQEPVASEVKRFSLYEGTESTVSRVSEHTPPIAPPPAAAPASHGRSVEDRLARMRELTIKLRTPSGISDLEREPAYMRKNVALTESPQSTDSSLSRYTLSEETDENGERRVELKRNNPYLHDNVD